MTDGISNDVAVLGFVRQIATLNWPTTFPLSSFPLPFDFELHSDAHNHDYLVVICWNNATVQKVTMHN